MEQIKNEKTFFHVFPTLKVEEEFDIEIPDDAVEQISTVQDAVNQIKSKKNA